MSDVPIKPEASFLERWSRRKREQADMLGAKAAEARGVGDGVGATNPSDATASRAPVPANSSEGTIPSGGHQSAASPETPLPALDDLTAESDVTGFLKQGVSEELKRLALRRMWTLDPQIRDFIEIAENQYDWNVPGGVPGFGPLAAGTDLEALLAQATGAVTEKPTEPGVPEDDATATASSTSAADGETHAATAEPQTPAALLQTVRGTDVEIPGEQPAEPVRIATPTDQDQAIRRRHGGALPV